jgi:peptidoglycan/LPS O-acetylase OafA/YrhL
MAALLVVIAHYFGEVPHGASFLMLGWLGVDIFFVLSGFLIGRIILAECEKPAFFTTFYIKRAARILPIYFVVIGITLFLSALLAGRSWSDTPFPAAVYVTFMTNFAMVFSNGGGVWLKPTWTLAVEEQFYLLLPLLIFMASRRRLATILISLWAGATLFRFFVHGNPNAALTLLPARMDLLLAGVLLALAQQSIDLRSHLKLLRIAALTGFVALLGIVVISPTSGFTLVGPSVASIGITCYMAAIINGAPEGKRYRSAVLCWFGQISYGLYLIHQPVAGILHGLLLDSKPDIASPAAFAVTILAVILSIGLAAVSWRWLEAPIIAYAKRNTRTAESLRVA